LTGRLEVANVHFEPTGNTRIHYDSSANTLYVTANSVVIENFNFEGANNTFTGANNVFTGKLTLDPAANTDAEFILSPDSDETASINVGFGRTGNGNSHIDLVTDTTYTDYGFRIIRGGGENADTDLISRGTGNLNFSVPDSGVVTIDDNPVVHTGSQTLSNTQKTQARLNIESSAVLNQYKNYIVNPGMRISQENGTSSGTASGYYPVDQFVAGHSQDGTLTFAQVQGSTPGGSTHRIRMTVTSADASIAAGQFATLSHFLEGAKVDDLLFGTNIARQIVLRFGWKSPAGTYAVSLRNDAANRSFVREFTISGGEANTDTVQTVTFPGDTTGTWPTGTVRHSIIGWAFAVGSTYQTTADSWQTGNYFGTSSTSNGIGTGSAVFELFDVGMYADPEATGVAPPFILPNYDEDYTACQRYWFKRESFTAYVSAATSTMTEMINFPVAMRSAPSMSAAVSYQLNVSSIAFNNATTLGARATIVSDAVGAAEWTGTVSLSARM
jgi:hypothetical protein